MAFRTARLLFVIVAALALPLSAALAADPGPPFPNPVSGQRVYDTAGVFRPDTITSLQTTIAAIEARTGAQVVVYTQVWPYKISQAESENNAAALIDQWGIGRKGFDDSLVILFDLDPSLVHGQVSLYAGAGFRSTFLSDSERQQIFDNDMLPKLEAGDLDGAALIAMQRVDAAATPEHAGQLQFARQANAVIGILGGALVLLGLGGWALFHWLRFGRDPVYVDSASVLVPAPPDGMTAATATLVYDGGTSRRSLTTALLDLASRGKVAFRESEGLLGLGRKKLSIDLGAAAAATRPSTIWPSVTRRRPARDLPAAAHRPTARVDPAAERAGGRTVAHRPRQPPGDLDRPRPTSSGVSSPSPRTRRSAPTTCRSSPPDVPDLRADAPGPCRAGRLVRKAAVERRRAMARDRGRGGPPRRRRHLGRHLDPDERPHPHRRSPGSPSASSRS